MPAETLTTVLHKAGNELAPPPPLRDDKMTVVKVAVCACTYRRPEGLRSLLSGIAAQRFTRVRQPEICIVVADNEGSRLTETICTEFSRTNCIRLTYISETRRGIPFARNACLEHIPPGFHFFATIDDDEVPEPQWIEELLLTQIATSAEVVRGRVVPEHPADAPQWIVKGRVFGWPRSTPAGPPRALVNGEELDGASTSNVLVSCEAVRGLGLTFDIRLAHTGGSDTLFFRQMKAAGCHIVYAAEAKVREMIQPGRASMRYVFLKQYRVANNRLINRRPEPKKRKKNPIKRLLREIKRSMLLKASRHVLGGLWLVLRSVSSVGSKQSDRAIGVLRLGNGIGLFSSILRIKYEIYLQDDFH